MRDPRHTRDWTGYALIATLTVLLVLGIIFN